MSVSEEFRRLLEHASARLAEEEPTVKAAFERLHEISTSSQERRIALLDRASYMTATTYARLVMEMTARFLTDESTSVDKPVDN